MDLSLLTRRRRTALWAAVVSGLLLSMLDQTIVGTALPEVARDLDGAGWYVWAFTAYCSARCCARPRRPWRPSSSGARCGAPAPRRSRRSPSSL